MTFLLVGIWVFFVVTCLYTGVLGLRGKPIAVPSRGGCVTGPVRGVAARVIGAMFFVIGLLLLIMPIVYSGRHP